MPSYIFTPLLIPIVILLLLIYWELEENTRQQKRIADHLCGKEKDEE